MTAEPQHFPPALLKAIEAFNREAFWDCHEILEQDLWLPATDPVEKSFYQGLLQVAAGCYHLARQNQTGAKSLLDKGLARLEPLAALPPFCRWLELDALLKEIRLMRERLCNPDPGDLETALRDQFPKITCLRALPENPR